MDTGFVHSHQLSVSPVKPIELKLFHGTCNSVIIESLQLPVLFLTAESMTIDFYVTLLDSSCSVVLGFNWLTHYNPLIDWVLDRITFYPQLLEPSCPTPASSARAAKLPSQNSASLKPFDSAPHVSLIGAAAFVCACKLPGAQSLRIHLSDISVSGKSASISDEAPDLSHIPKEYHDYADVFSKAKADMLGPHRPYNLQINLEEGASPPVGAMYSLSQSELSTLHEFLDEHVCIGFI